MPDYYNTDHGDVSAKDWDTIEELVNEYASDMSATELLIQLSNKLPRYFKPVRTGHYIVLGICIGKVAAVNDIQTQNREN